MGLSSLRPDSHSESKKSVTSFRYYHPRCARDGGVGYIETKRMDWHSLQKLSFKTDLHTTTPALVCLEQHVRQSLLPRVFLTGHCLQRLRQYVNTRSKCGSYVELYIEEYRDLQKLPQWLGKSRFQVVEVGFNDHMEVCKIALTLKLSTDPKCTRTLFLALGMDGACKTLYVTPYFKYRPSYQGQVPYLRREDFLTWRHR